MRRPLLNVIFAFFLVLLDGSRVRADSPPKPNAQADIVAAFTAARKSAILGPRRLKLLDEADIGLAADEVFIPATDANRIMTAMGNGASPARQGLILSRRHGAVWLVDVKWVKEGYVRDGDAKDWKADALLDNLRQGTEQGNTDRLARGIPALDVVGWVQPPAYDAAAHRLVWSLALRDRGAPTDAARTINYNTYALGRDGYFSLDLISDSTHIDADRGVARDLLNSLTYAQGKKYQDFNGSTDKVAAYGLAALIGVVAVKKLGLLAIVGAFLIKVWKLGLVALAAGAAAVRRFFNRGAPKAGR